MAHVDQPVAGTRHADTTDVGSSRPEDGTGRRAFVTLSVVNSPDQKLVGVRASMPGDTFLLGRDISAQGLSLADPSISRLHARCVWDSRMRSFRLIDAESRNGTFVNGRRVETTLLCHGDTVRIGDSLLAYHEDDPMAQAKERLERTAPSTLTVLLSGETGTGKEVFARRIHALSGRRGAFIAVNCASIPRDLLAAELFGHAKHAFSGAGQARPGLVMAASGGTLLLDEVGDCPPEVQAALLRVLQEKAVRPLGADRERPVDLRVIAASLHDLEHAVAGGTFRADLFARLAQATIALPPLRERKHELFELARAFAREEGAELRVEADALEALLCWHWPFNIRELQSLVRSLVVMRGSLPTLDLPYLQQNHPNLAARVADRQRGHDSSSRVPLAETAAETGLAHDSKRLRALLNEHAGNVSHVAKALGKPRSQIYRWMSAFGLSADPFRRP